jgi:hypothetical protein
MPQDTPNHSYNRPDKGAEDWDTPINTNFENLDTDIEIRDTGGPTEGQNSYDPSNGAKYLDTDSGIVYTGDGSTWTATHAVARFTPKAGGVGSIALGDASNTVGTNAGNIVTGGQNNDADGPYAAVGGGDGNTATGQESAIPGGLNNTASGTRSAVSGGSGNEATAPEATVGGGENNAASASDATVAGGQGNTASANSATVGGGFNNLADAEYATVAGGGVTDTQNADSTRNAVYDNYGTIAGGGSNTAGTDDDTVNATYATVAGGRNNTASGQYSVAMGRNATADNDGALVVGDSTSTPVSSDAVDQAVFQQSVITRGSFETAASYNFADTAMFTTSSVNNDDNDQWSVAIPDLYGAAIPQFTVENTGDVTVRGDLQVDGNLNRNLGVEVTRDSDQSIPDGSETRVEFNDVQTDDNSEWDNNNYEFIADNSGAYLVDLGIRFTESMAQGTTYTVRIYNDGFFEARSTNATPPQGGAVSEVSVQFSKTVWNVGAGDNIYVTVELSGDSNTIAVDYDETWLDIVRLG